MKGGDKNQSIDENVSGVKRGTARLSHVRRNSDTNALEGGSSTGSSDLGIALDTTPHNNRRGKSLTSNPASLPDLAVFEDLYGSSSSSQDTSFWRDVGLALTSADSADSKTAESASKYKKAKNAPSPKNASVRYDDSAMKQVSNSNYFHIGSQHNLSPRRSPGKDSAIKKSGPASPTHLATSSSSTTVSQSSFAYNTNILAGGGGGGGGGMNNSNVSNSNDNNDTMAMLAQQIAPVDRDVVEFAPLDALLDSDLLELEQSSSKSLSMSLEHDNGGSLMIGTLAKDFDNNNNDFSRDDLFTKSMSEQSVTQQMIQGGITKDDTGQESMLDDFSLFSPADDGFAFSSGSKDETNTKIGEGVPVRGGSFGSSNRQEEAAVNGVGVGFRSDEYPSQSPLPHGYVPHQQHQQQQQAPSSSTRSASSSSLYYPSQHAQQQQQQQQQQMLPPVLYPLLPMNGPMSSNATAMHGMPHAHVPPPMYDPNTGIVYYPHIATVPPPPPAQATTSSTHLAPSYPFPYAAAPTPASALGQAQFAPVGSGSTSTGSVTAAAATTASVLSPGQNHYTNETAPSKAGQVSSANTTEVLTSNERSATAATTALQQSNSEGMLSTIPRNTSTGSLKSAMKKSSSSSKLSKENRGISKSPQSNPPESAIAVVAVSAGNSVVSTHSNNSDATSTATSTTTVDPLKSNKKSSTSTKKEKNRGSYRCGRCGKPKVNHVCEFIDTAVASLGIQAQGPVIDPRTLQPFPGDRVLTVTPFRKTIQDVHSNSSSFDSFGMVMAGSISLDRDGAAGGVGQQPRGLLSSSSSYQLGGHGRSRSRSRSSSGGLELSRSGSEGEHSTGTGTGTGDSSSDSAVRPNNAVGFSDPIDDNSAHANYSKGRGESSQDPSARQVFAQQQLLSHSDDGEDGGPQIGIRNRSQSPHDFNNNNNNDINNDNNDTNTNTKTASNEDFFPADYAPGSRPGSQMPSRGSSVNSTYGAESDTSSAYGDGPRPQFSLFSSNGVDLGLSKLFRF